MCTCRAIKNDFGVFQLFLADNPDGTSAIPHRRACWGAGPQVAVGPGAGFPDSSHVTSSGRQRRRPLPSRTKAAPQSVLLVTEDMFTCVEVAWGIALNLYQLPGCRTKVKTRLETAYGEWVERIPAWIKWATQEWNEIQYNGVYYEPPETVRLSELSRVKASCRILEYDFRNVSCQDGRLRCYCLWHVLGGCGRERCCKIRDAAPAAWHATY
jgi:hypothetical protein